MYQKTAVVVLILFIVGAFWVVASHDRSVPETAVGEMSPLTEEQAPSTAGMEVEDEPGVGMPMGKFDVRAVCQSALMYMSFMDGASAEAFVEECVEGKHPEVIERYINEQGLDGAVI
jgi:hypothetical protein